MFVTLLELRYKRFAIMIGYVALVKLFNRCYYYYYYYYLFSTIYGE